MISIEDVEKDVDCILWSMQFCNVIRYMDQFYWLEETARTCSALTIDCHTSHGSIVPRSESNADHSWHMADMVMLLAPRFPQLDMLRCLMLATLHDKLEIIMGDYDPSGSTGTGNDTHAFNTDKKELKREAEKQALQQYLSRLNHSAREIQSDILSDVIELRSPESKFVKALDRLQPLAYIVHRKNGVMEGGHIEFTLKYLSTYHDYFPELQPYYESLSNRLIATIAERRHVSIDGLKKNLKIELL